MTTEQEKEQPEIGIPSPGHLLSAKRQEYGWTMRDVARALRLSERQVEAIEADDYDNLPGKTYVMGYWRSYSQLLKIPLEESIQVHRSHLRREAVNITLNPGGKEVRANDERSRKHAAVLFALLLALVLVAIWYWQSSDVLLRHWLQVGMERLDQPLDSAENGQAPSASKPINPDNIELAVTENEEPESVLALPVPNFSEDEAEQTTEINTKGYEVLSRDFPLSAANLIYQSSAATDPEASESGVADDQEVAARAEPETVTSTGVADAPTSLDLVFKVDRESWIDVRDSSGERLIYRTVNRGEDIQLQGVPPYSVFIGSAEGVAVEYQGKPVEFKVHESGLFARFEVGI